MRMTTLLLCLVILLPGCAITTTAGTGPNNKPVHTVDATSATRAYAKAAKVCPQGYRQIGAAQRRSKIEFIMSFECAE